MKSLFYILPLMFSSVVPINKAATPTYRLDNSNMYSLSSNAFMTGFDYMLSVDMLCTSLNVIKSNDTGYFTIAQNNQHTNTDFSINFYSQFWNDSDYSLDFRLDNEITFNGEVIAERDSIDSPYIVYTHDIIFNVESTRPDDVTYSVARVTRNTFNLDIQNFIYCCSERAYITQTGYYNLSASMPLSNLNLPVGTSAYFYGLWSRNDDTSTNRVFGMLKGVNYDKLYFYRDFNGNYSVSISSTISEDSYNFTLTSLQSANIVVYQPIWYYTNSNGYGTNVFNHFMLESYNGTTSKDFNDLVFTIVDVPIYTIYSLLNFKILGVNMFLVVTSLITAVLLLWVLRKFI